MMQLPRSMKQWLGRGVVCLSLGLLVSWQAMAKPVGRFDHAKAQYEETRTDLVVKVLGGEVKIKRRYRDGEWLFNPQWVTLKLNRVTPDGTPSDDARYPVSSINRDLYIYEKSRVLQADENIVARFVYEHDPSKHILQTRTGFIWEDRSGDQIFYDLEGKIVRYQDKNSVTVSFNRDSEGNMTGILDHHGTQVVTLNYIQGNLVAVRDYSGRQVSYQWDNMALMQVTDVNGHEWRYEYQTLLNKPYMHKAIDPEGQEVVFTNRISRSGVVNISSQPFSGSSVGGVVAYGGGTGQISGGIRDNRGDLGQRSINAKPMVVLTKKSYGDGAYIRYQAFYNAQDERYTTVEKTSDGSEILKTFAKDGQAGEVSIGGKRLYTQIKSGNRRVIEDGLGNRTEILFDQWDNPINITYADKSTETVTYHSNFNLPLEYRDRRGVVTRFRYDQFGNVVELEQGVGSLERQIITTEYDEFGQFTKLQVLGADTSVAAAWLFQYDRYGNLIQYTDGRGVVWKFGDYTAAGKPQSATDGRGEVWRYQYDQRDQLTLVTTPEGAVADRHWALEYNKLGELAFFTDPRNVRTSYRYDRRGHLNQVSDALGLLVESTYLLDGRLQNSTDGSGLAKQFSYDKQLRLKRILDGVGNVTKISYVGENNSAIAWESRLESAEADYHYRYDALGQVTEISQQQLGGEDIRTQKLVYNQNDYPEVVIDPNGNETSVSFDALGRPVTKKDALGGLSTITYTALGDIASVTDAENRTTRYEYDTVGNRTAEVLPMGERFEFEYDPNNNLVVKRFPSGAVIRYSYDLDNRLIKEVWYAAVHRANDFHQPEREVHYDYFANGQLKGYQISDSSGVTGAEYQYDARGQLLLETTHFPTFSKPIQYGYYGNGQLKQVIAPDGNEASYRYDKAGRLLVATMKDSGSVSFVGYQGQLPTEMVYPGGINRQQSYDGFGNLQQIIVSDREGKILEQYNHHYDLAGNLRSKTTLAGDFQYQYDKLDRLIEATQPTPHQNLMFDYDAVGNRIESQDESLWQYNANHQLTQMGEMFYRYDDNGNLISEHQGAETATAQREYRYNANGRLNSVTSTNHATVAYDYDPQGRRVSSISADEKNYFLYSQQGLIGVYDEQGSLQSGYQYSPDARWGQMPWYQTTTQGEGGGFYQNDHLGTPFMMLKSNGQTLWQASYDAFGRAEESITVTQSNLRFPGQWLDRTTGHHYNFYRDYAPEIGRYVQRDPIGLVGGLNTYGYANGNPNRYIDPLGLCPWCIGGIVGGGVAVAAYWEAYQCGDISFPEYIGAVAIGAGAGAISGGASILSGITVAGVGSALQQKITAEEVNMWDVAISSITAGVGGKLGQGVSKIIYPSKYVHVRERKWYTLWLYRHKVVKEVWNDTGRRTVDSAVSGTAGGGLSALPGALQTTSGRCNDSNDCGNM